MDCQMEQLQEYGCKRSIEEAAFWKSYLRKKSQVHRMARIWT